MPRATKFAVTKTPRKTKISIRGKRITVRFGESKEDQAFADRFMNAVIEGMQERGELERDVVEDGSSDDDQNDR